LLKPFIVDKAVEFSIPKITLAVDDVPDKEPGSNGWQAALPVDIFVHEARDAWLLKASLFTGAESVGLGSTKGCEEVADTDVLGDEDEDPGSCDSVLERACAVEGPGPAENSIWGGSSDCASAAAAASDFFSAASFLCCSSWSNKESLMASITIN